ncbi:MAG: hypothetical protein QXD69_04170 [Candidatus Bathyarchaeia archaeon]
MTLEFEIKDRDAGARLGKIRVKGKTVETPLFLPVYNPNIPIIPPVEMKEKYEQLLKYVEELRKLVGDSAAEKQIK